MILTDQSGTKLLLFGTGDIGFGVCNNEIAIAFWQEEPGEIGRELAQCIGKPASELNTQVILQFTASQSVQALINMLQIINENLESHGI